MAETEVSLGQEALKQRTFYRFRAEILETAVRLENNLDEVISAAYGQNASTAQELRAEILGSVSIGQRIGILRRIMDSRDLSDRYPFVVPILQKAFELRNTMAHSVSNGYDADFQTIALVSIRKGQAVKKFFTLPYLRWIFEQASQVEKELDEMFWLVAPMNETWHDS